MKTTITAGHEVFREGTQVEVYRKIIPDYKYNGLEFQGFWDTSLGIIHERFLDIHGNERQGELFPCHF